MERRCIYCGTDADLSESDIIPDALTNARIMNKNVCRIAHNNQFSDMFESKVISALSFITNELDIKSSKSAGYPAYHTTVTIEGNDYEAKIRSDRDLLGNRVLTSSDKQYKFGRYDKSHLQGYHKEKPPEMDGFNYFRYSPRPEGGSLGYSSSSKLSNGPLRPERWSLVYSTFSSTPLSISFLACAEGSAE